MEVGTDNPWCGILKICINLEIDNAAKLRRSKNSERGARYIFELICI